MPPPEVSVDIGWIAFFLCVFLEVNTHVSLDMVWQLPLRPFSPSERLIIRWYLDSCVYIDPVGSHAPHHFHTSWSNCHLRIVVLLQQKDGPSTSQGQRESPNVKGNGVRRRKNTRMSSEVDLVANVCIQGDSVVSAIVHNYSQLFNISSVHNNNNWN